MLDEAHTVKSSKSQVSMAAAFLNADRRWCLTGTPIQVNKYETMTLQHMICDCFFNVIFNYLH